MALDDFSDYNENNIGEILFHIGNISEDILPDGKKQFENGLQRKSKNFQVSNWGKTPTSQSLTYSFSSNVRKETLKILGMMV